MYIPKHFKAYELLPKDFYESHTIKGDQLWWMFDSRILITGDALRERYGKILMNTWFWGGAHQYRGWRPFDCEIGAELSQHKFGRACDWEFVDVTAEEVRQDIKKHPGQFPYVTCIEEGVSWLHGDCRNWDRNKHGILYVNP